MTDDDDLHEPVDDATDSSDAVAEAVSGPQRERRENRIKRENREAREFWIAVLDSPVGRREMWRLFCAPSDNGAHAFETKFVPGPNGFPDPNAAWYQRGVQDFGLRAYRFWLTLDPFLVAKMHEENEFGKKG